MPVCQEMIMKIYDKKRRRKSNRRDQQKHQPLSGFDFFFHLFRLSFSAAINLSFYFFKCSMCVVRHTARNYTLHFIRKIVILPILLTRFAINPPSLIHTLALPRETKHILLSCDVNTHTFLTISRHTYYHLKLNRTCIHKVITTR